MNKDELLTIDNFIVKINNSILEEFIESVSCCEEHSLLGVCKYILNNQEEWQNVIDNIQPFLKEYGLAYEDSKELNIKGENFVIEAIYNEIYSIDIAEYREAIGI